MDLRRRSVARLIFWSAVLVKLLAGGPAGAQVFSPGELSRVHAHIDSLRSCDQCHAGRQKLDREKCLDCHTLIKTSIQAREGYHGQAQVRSQACEQCHTDHKGRGASIIAWPSGRAERFPHAQAGWPLKGEHARIDCQKCHEPRRVESTAVLEYLKKHNKKSTFLGLETDCTSCHFDEHRGTLKGTCDSCHNEKEWKPAPGFKHDKSWKLERAHARVECKECHEPVRDPSFVADAYPKPRAATFLKMKPLEHEQCTDCHTDPHRSRFGQNCRSCHTLEDWSVKSKAGVGQDIAFHDKTAWPLEGAHQTVACDTCHPKAKSGKRHLKPIAHDRCDQCHPNAHPELPQEGPDRGDCDDCHTVDVFTPSSFKLEDHEKTHYPLEGAHLAVACDDCHAQALGPAREAGRARPAKNFLAQRVLSSWLLKVQNRPLEDCETCHQTPHRDQLTEKECADCHALKTWQIDADFDHSKTRYKLTDKHRDVDCALCHPAERDPKGEFVRYRPIPFDDCAPCHKDVHYSQFTRLEPELACSRCHQPTGFKELLFEHNEPDLSDWPLEGKHELATCKGCHPTVQLAAGVKVQRFRPSPTRCETCHVDPHEGAYREAARLVPGPWNTAVRKEGLEQAAPWGLPEAWQKVGGEKPTACEVCHEAKSWQEIGFDHSRTGYPLKGRHKQARCQDCHQPDRAERVSTDCGDCHENVHQGTLGYTCQECHNEESFKRPILPIARHARTSFPLTGKHAITACRECHVDTRGLSFQQAPSDCFTCHEQALASVGAGAIDHSSFSSSCGQCHTALSWKSASYRQHDRCFPISPGREHWGFSCGSCHPGSIPAATGTCADSGVSCISCHSCEQGEHVAVRGYECADRKCYQCHPGGE